MELIRNLLKYVIEGLAVAAAAHYIPKMKLKVQELIMLGATAAVTLLLIDLFAPRLSDGLRLGSGFGIGRGLVGGAEGFSPISYDHRWNDEYLRPQTEMPPEDICFNRPPSHVKWPLYGRPNPHGI